MSEFLYIFFCDRFAFSVVLWVKGGKSVYYYPHRAADALLENPDMKKSELPGDEITVTVTFKDGKKARKVITVSFDDEGYAQFSLK